VNAVTLTSNGAPIPFTAQYFGPLRESDASTLGADGLRARYNADGYVMLRNAVPAETIWNVREAYLKLFDRATFKDGDPRRGEFSGKMPDGLPSHGLEGHPAHTFVRSETFRAFAQMPAFHLLAETFFGGAASLIRRTPLRHFIPGRKVASRAHLDRTYIDGVPADVVTVWVPLGDCPINAGGLLYLEGSHADADLEQKVRGGAPMDRSNDARPLTHDLRWISEHTGKRWLSTDFKAGDVVIHSPTIVHASTDPLIDMMRVSTDIRFQRAGSPSDPRWDNDWSADDGY
jgi:hypothetical protein